MTGAIAASAPAGVILAAADGSDAAAGGPRLRLYKGLATERHGREFVNFTLA